VARRPGKKDPKSKTHSIDELSVMAGERWEREDAAKKLAEEEGTDVPREPRRARPRLGHNVKRRRTSLGGDHS
jgi:hypothetical protein